MEVNHTTLNKLKREILEKVLDNTAWDETLEACLNINKVHIYFTTDECYMKINSVYYDKDGYISIDLVPCEEEHV